MLYDRAAFTRHDFVSTMHLVHHFIQNIYFGIISCSGKISRILHTLVRHGGVIALIAATATTTHRFRHRLFPYELS